MEWLIFLGWVWSSFIWKRAQEGFSGFLLRMALLFVASTIETMART